MSPRAKAGHLLLIGGAERRDAEGIILRRFVELAGGENARLIVCAAATSHPVEVLREYEEVFGALGAAITHDAAFRDRAEGEDPKLLEALDEATGVFFTGGNQLQITSLIAGTPFEERLEERLMRDGLTVAGTSAGAAAMSSVMIADGPAGGTVRREDVRLAPGLGLWRNSVIDSHFNQRGRMSRVLTVLAQNPQVVGVGIDEDTAIELTIGKGFRVLGSGVVIFVHCQVVHTNAFEAGGDEALALLGPSVHVLPQGYGFDLQGMRPVLPDD